MIKVKCGFCEKDLMKDMDIIFSLQTGEYYCGHDCAGLAFFEFADANVINPHDKGDLESHGLKVSRGKIVKEE